LRLDFQLSMRLFLYRYRVLLLHLSFWGTYCSFHFYQIQQEVGWRKAMPGVLIPLFFNLLLSYFNYGYLLPRWLDRQRTGRYLLKFCAAFALCIVLKVQALRYFTLATVPHTYLYSLVFVISSMGGTLFVVLFIGLLRFWINWFALEAKTKALENEQLHSELRFLKAQINPHFLFNTLNNLYYLAYTQSPKTPEVVAQLAQMMRYLLEDSNQPTVPLSQEIEFMRSYVSLEQLRLNYPAAVDFSVMGEPAGVCVAPLLLMTFLENAFKHGVHDGDPAAWVRVGLRVSPSTCEYTVANGRRPARSAVPQPGTGLLNVRRRLALAYPDRHELQLTEAPDQFYVHLTLYLS
jgi:two-component system sensor histidine kinase AlgZ